MTTMTMLDPPSDGDHDCANGSDRCTSGLDKKNRYYWWQHF